MSPYKPALGQPLSSLDTPSIVVDLDVMEHNISTMMSLLLPTGVCVRPHLKTTKSPTLAARLIGAGCTGGCVAKLSEAEVMMDGGIDDIFITCEIVGPVKVARLVDLVKRAPKLRCVVDSVEGARAFSQASEHAAVSHMLMVLVDVDIGQHRTGVQPEEPALRLAREVAEMSKLEMMGVHGYDGHLQHIYGNEARKQKCLSAMKALVDTAQALRENGHNIRVVTTGSTGTAEWCADYPGVTEVQPGSFIFMDSEYRAVVGGERFKHALTVMATVISRPEERRVVIDTGLKSLTTDSGYAEVQGLKEIKYADNRVEHGLLTWEQGVGLRIGDRVHMIPSHIDPTINLHDYYYAHRDGWLEEIWPVAARGKVQ